MATNREFEKVEVVPPENADEVAQNVRAFFRGRLKDRLALRNAFSNRYLDEYAGGHMTLELGGYVPHPTRPDQEINVECSISVQWDDRFSDDHLPVEDPNGDLWHRHRLHASVNWPSWGAGPVPVARLRAELIAATVELAAQFDEMFGNTTVWTRGMTKAEREAWELKHRKDSTRVTVGSTIREAIHTTCRGMRVNDERVVDAPTGDLVPGDYAIETDRKEYKASVYMGRRPGASEDVLRVHFRRTK